MGARPGRWIARAPRASLIINSGKRPFHTANHLINTNHEPANETFFAEKARPSRTKAIFVRLAQHAVISATPVCLIFYIHT